MRVKEQVYGVSNKKEKKKRSIERKSYKEDTNSTDSLGGLPPHLAAQIGQQDINLDSSINPFDSDAVITDD